MKPIRILVTCISLLLPFFFVFSQEINPEKNIIYDQYPFAKGKNLFTHQRYLMFQHSNLCDNGQKYGTSDAFDIRKSYKYFPVKDLGIGFDLDIDRSGFHQGNIDDLARSWALTPNISYGLKLSTKVNIYGEAGISFGAVKDIYKTPGNTNTDKTNLFGYNIGVGLPIRLDNFGSTFFTPQLSYNYLRSKDDFQTIKNNGVQLSLGMQSFLRCSEIACDCRKKHNFSGNMYDQGRNFIYSSMAGLGIGKSTYEYTMGPITTTQKDNLTNLNLKLDYGHYLFNNFGIGASAVIRNSVQESDDNSIKYTGSRYSFSPKAFVHIPTNTGWNNIFGQMEYKFGFEKSVTKFNNNITTFKNNISGWEVGIGYNQYFTERTAATFYGSYVDRTSKEKDIPNPVKQQEGRINFQVGLKYSW